MSDQDKLNILIIDDNDISRAMLRFILSSVQRYKVVGEAANGAQGLAMTEKLHPAVVCLDVMLPDTNGVELLKKIKEQWPEIAVLMVTGSNDADTVRTAVQGGAAGYIVKPFNPATLLGTMEKAEAKLRARPG
ncbi:response regulator [soil metagenome]